MFGKSFVQAIATTVMLAGAAQAFSNTVYVISNAETVSLALPGLTPVGYDRAHNCIPPIFAGLDIGLILTCTPDFDSGLCRATEATAAPVAAALSLTPDTTCRGDDDDDDDECLYRVISTFAQTSTKAVLVVWDINELDDVFESLDVDDDFEFDELNGDDDDETTHFDLMATIADRRVTSVTSMACDGIDGQAPGTFRRRSFNKARNMKKKRSAAAFHSRIARGHKA
ncbi:hypothetical protein BJ165DRAFT_629755 [Panaeolus papilionaceus]|nr:hypothetical protein BJ165DRAFT_629755 [Panaeolus papilionaceus]